MASALPRRRWRHTSLSPINLAARPAQTSPALRQEIRLFGWVIAEWIAGTVYLAHQQVPAGFDRHQVEPLREAVHQLGEMDSLDLDLPEGGPASMPFGTMRQPAPICAYSVMLCRPPRGWMARLSDSGRWQPTVRIGSLHQGSMLPRFETAVPQVLQVTAPSLP